MKNKVWLPRILAVLFIGFLSLFALDMFGEGYRPLELVLGLLMHLMPTLLLLFALVVAWKKPIWGGWGFVLLGLVSVVFFKTYEDPVVLGLISIPPMIIGGLFVWVGRKREE